MTNYLIFDGYCPESKLKGEQVEMRLNDMDFWESEKTGLQMTVFPPYAAILQWRGAGKFREQSNAKATTHKGLILAKAKRNTGSEIFPDETQVLYDSADLEEYIFYLDESYTGYESRRFNEKAPVFDEQKEGLAKVTQEQFSELYKLFKKSKNDVSSPEFQKFHEKLYEYQIIFNFNWMRWYDGYDFLEDAKSDYSQLPVLNVSMLLTSIFRSEIFTPSTIEKHLNNGVIGKLMERMITLHKSKN